MGTSIVLEKLKKEVEALRARQNELAESLSSAITTAYDQSRRRLRRTRQRLGELKDEAVEGLDRQTDLALEQLAVLDERLEEGVKAMGQTTLAVARRVEQGIASRAHRIEARTTLLFAKMQVMRASRLAQKGKFVEAEQRLEDAAELLRAACANLNEAHIYNEQLDAIKTLLREAAIALQVQAEDVGLRIESVLSETDQLIGSMESEERRDAKRKAE
jgi:hypothetical protein